MSIRERISAVDTAWLRMEHPTNRMMIVGVFMFKEKLHFDQMRTVLESRWLQFRRFKQKAVQDATGAWWVNDENFDINNHLRKVRLPGRAGKKELENLVSRLASKGLDPSRPLWEFAFVENYCEGSALIPRIHHCYADGIALIGVMLSLTGKDPAESLVIPKARHKRQGKDESDFWTSVIHPVADVWNGVAKLTQILRKHGAEITRDPATVRDIALKGIDIAEELRKIALMESDSPTRFKGPLGVQSAWLGPTHCLSVR